MIKKIAHLADIHIRKNTARHQEYRTVFSNLISKLKIDQPDRIVIAGDLFNDYIKLEGELLILAADFLKSISEISPVVITRGNHDVARSAIHRIDAIHALVATMDNNRIKYYNTTDLHEDENVVWAVWKHGDKRNNPWPKNFVKDPNKIYIDIFHDPINGARNSEGFEFNSKTYHSITEFMGDISLFGDIHMLQYLDSTKTKAYSSSLIEQNFAEGDEQFHGYLLWNLDTLTAKEVKIDNPYGHFTLDLNRYTDFDNLQLNINSNIPNKRIRLKWKTLPGLKTIENMRKVDTVLINKYTPIYIKHVNDFIEEKKIEIQEKEDIENINKREVIHKILSEYLTKMGHKEEIINGLLELDVEIENRLSVEDMTNIQWSIVGFGGKNFRSYDDIEVNWNNQDGLYQIVGENGVGKSTINQLITYILFGKSPETDFRKKFGDARFINNKLNTTSCEGWIILEVNGEFYGIKRITQIKRNKEGELTAASTIASYYKLTSPTDKLDENSNLEKLNEEERRKTQNRIDEIIGTYENFMRVTLTTSDTLNNILQSDKAPFIDSLLYDSGLDIFDLRSKEFKKYKDELIIDKSLANVNVNIEENSISSITDTIKFNEELIESTKEKISLQNSNLELLNKQKETLQQSMHQIDLELSNTNESQINNNIDTFNRELQQIVNEELNIQKNVDSLKSIFDQNRFEELQKKKDNHKAIEFEKRTAINKKRMEIEQHRNVLIRLNGDIELLKKEGSNYKKEIANLEQSKVCDRCNQTIDKEEHKEHIKQNIAKTEKLMFAIADKIRIKENEKPSIIKNIELAEINIKEIETEIQNDSLGFQNILEEIGKLSNDKLEVEKRERLILVLNSYPLKKDNINMKINELNLRLKKYHDQKTYIEENNKIRFRVNELNNQINILIQEIDNSKKLIFNTENNIKSYKIAIENKRKLINDYLEYERKEQIRKLYAETIHRDGLPTQILSDTLLPKINNLLSKLLESADFDVYLDKDDLRLKFFYNDHPTAIIDCISASGMERTFAVYALKIALNQINNKSKSTLLTVDEVMGKLKGEYVDKFVELLHLSKKFYKKVLIIEPTHEVNPDYLLQIEKNEKHISKLIIN